MNDFSYDGVRQNWCFAVRGSLPIVDVTGIINVDSEELILKSAVKIIEIAEECNGILYPNGIVHQTVPRDLVSCMICYFAVLFKEDKMIEKFKRMTQNLL